MKEIKRYSPTKSIHDNGSSESCECNSYAYCEIDSNGDYVEHSDYLKEVEQLQSRIKELESEKHINEIKAQGIAEAIKYIDDHSRVVTDVISANSLLRYADKLRTKHE